MREVLAVGYAAVDKIAGSEYLGGAAAGIAINGKRIGIDTGLLALFGDDTRSKRYLKYLSELGVDSSQSLAYTDTNLPVNNLLNDNISGWDDSGISKHVPSVSLNENGLNSYEIVHLASPHPELVKKVVEKKTKGIITYTPGPLITVNADNLNITALRSSTILFLNEDEWQVVKCKFDVVEPNDIIDLGPKIIVTTLGDKGAEIFYRKKDKQERILIPPSLVDEPETTGAGDAFSLGFLFGYIQNLSLDLCGKMGSRLASYAVKRNGVIIEDSNLDQFKQEFFT
ncbi:MAG: PfkB family carbohydrate kinase [bacterium]